MPVRLLLAAAFGLSLAGFASGQPKDAPKELPPDLPAPKEPPAPPTADLPPAVPDGPILIPIVGPKIWFSADQLLWWTKGQPIREPLITLGSSADPIPGALGQPNTQILFGDERVGYGTRAGLRLGIGGWIDDDGVFGWEAYGFWLARRSSGVRYSSNGSGDAAYAQPTIDPLAGESAYSTSLQGFIAGSIWARTSSSLHGWETNALLNLARNGTAEFSLIAGFRQLTVRETLRVTSDIYALPECTLSFNGGVIDAGDHLVTRDYFRTANNFYGPQIGGKYSVSNGRFGIDLVGKIAIGVTQQQLCVAGDTTWFPAAGPPETAAGGILAQTTNINRYYRPDFAVLPEVTFDVWYDLNAWSRVGIGYTFLYLSSIVRPGQVIDRTVDPGRVPSDQLFGTGTAGNSPGIHFRESGFWAQGLNFTFSIRY